MRDSRKFKSKNIGKSFEAGTRRSNININKESIGRWEKNFDVFANATIWENEERGLTIFEPFSKMQWEDITNETLSQSTKWVVEFGKTEGRHQTKFFRDKILADEFVDGYKRGNR